MRRPNRLQLQQQRNGQRRVVHYAEPFYDCDGNCLNDADSDGVCDELEVLGCDDPIACNFNSSATDNDGSCTYAEPFYDCDGNCLNDADSDGVCDELEIDWMRRIPTRATTTPAQPN